MATQKATFHIYLTVLNVANLTPQQYIPNHLTYRQSVLFAMAASPPTTKDVPCIKNCSNAAASHSAQDT